MEKLSKLWFITTSALVGVHLLVSLFVSSSYGLHLFADVLQSVLLLACYLFTLPSQVTYRGRTAAFWTLVAIGFALWLLNQVLWTFYEVVLQKPPTPGFWGDVVLFLHAIPLMMALAVRPQLGSVTSPTRLNVINASFVLVWWTYLYMYFVWTWQYVAPDDNIYASNFNFVYGAANVGVALLAGISAWRSTNKWRVLYTHLLGAASLYAVASYIASAAIDRHAYYSGSVYDIPLVAALAWFAGFALAGKELKVSPDHNEGPSRDVLGSYLAVAAILAVPITGIWRASLESVPAVVAVFRMLLTCGATMLLAGLFFLRQVFARKSVNQVMRDRLVNV